MALETVQNIITSARYDLRDTRDTQFENDELLDYFNRSLKVLDSELIRMDSDYVQHQDERMLVSGKNYVTLPTTTASVEEVWTGTSNEAEKTTVRAIKYKRKFISTTGAPQYWAMEGINVIFDYTADADYTITSETVIRSDIHALDDDAPYNDEFNEPLRQAVVLIGKNRQEYDIRGSALIQQVFSEAAFARVIRRSGNPKRYKIDW